uniref:Hepatocyte nuclear factor 4-beta n=3 Tax=Schistocephalus solidus TaxID=70667 RepID=A0A0V0J706_SCHSO
MKTQLLHLIGWVKRLDCFAGLDMQDQLSLLRGNAAELLLLCLVWQACVSGKQIDDSEISMGHSPNRRVDSLYRVEAPDIKRPTFANSPAAAQTIPRCLGETLFALASTTTFPTVCPDSGLAWLLKVIAANVYQPIQELGLNETEVICLKAIIFFSPTSSLLSSNGRLLAESSRNKLQVELMNLMNDNQYLSEGRFGELLLLIPTLQRVAQLLVMKIAAARRDGLHVDELLCDILLGEEIRVPLMLPALDVTNMQLQGPFNANTDPADSAAMGFRGEVRQDLEPTEWRPVDGGQFSVTQPLTSCPDRSDVHGSLDVGHSNSWVYENMSLSAEAQSYKQPPVYIHKIEDELPCEALHKDRIGPFQGQQIPDSKMSSSTDTFVAMTNGHNPGLSCSPLPNYPIKKKTA